MKRRLTVKVILVTICLVLIGRVDATPLIRDREVDDDSNNQIIGRDNDNFDTAQFRDNGTLLNALESSS